MNRTKNYDVVIVGGGTAGCAAAVGAARAGAKTLLIERNPYLGGEATHSGVAAFCGFYTCGGDPVKVVAGAGDLVLKEMEALGPTVDYIVSAVGNKNVNFQPEYLKCALDNLLDKEGVDYYLHTTVIEASVENDAITSITCFDDEGTFTVNADTFVDASGDANLSHLAGAKTFWHYNDSTSVQTATLPFRLSGVDTSCDLSPAAVEKAVKQAKEAGIPHLTRERGFVLKKESSNTVAVLLPSVIPTSLTAEEVTSYEKDTRKQVLYYVEAFRKYLPGMENCELAVIGPSIGFRETRKLLGHTVITADDVLSRRKYDNSVARGGWKPEIHKSLNEAATYLDVDNGSYFDIPLTALQSVNISNLYGAGRIVSSDEAAFAAVRVMGTCFATGHGAGVAAACQAKQKTVDISEIRAELERQGALI